jgi:hypothetical protein
MPAHSAADIQNFAELRQRRAATNKFRFTNCPRFIDPGMKELEPTIGIKILSTQPLNSSTP